MKYIGLLSLGFVLGMGSAYGASGDDYVIGSCTLKLGKNDTTLDFLKYSKLSTGEFTIKPYSKKRISLNFQRVVPYHSDPAKYRKHQVVTFQSDKESIQPLIDQKIEATAVPFKGDLDITLEYRGRDYQGKRTHVVVDYVDTTGQLKGEKGQYQYFSSGKKTIEESFDVSFNFKDYSYKGFLGISGFINDEIEESGTGTHKAKAKLKCKLSLNEQVVVEETTEEDIKKKKEEEKYVAPKAEEFKGGIIISSGVTEE